MNTQNGKTAVALAFVSAHPGISYWVGPLPEKLPAEIRAKLRVVDSLELRFLPPVASGACPSVETSR